jgi:hypothetical protein
MRRGHPTLRDSAGRECWLAASVPSRFPDRQHVFLIGKGKL